MAERVQNKIKPQPGAQTAFLQSPADIVIYGGGGGGGKAVSLNTPIPTINSFKLMGNIVPGDVIFDENGKPCNVIAISPINYRRVFEVIFDDGSIIKANDVHEWITLTDRERTQNSRLTEKFRTNRRSLRPSRAQENPQKPGSKKNITLLNQLRKYEYKNPIAGNIRTTLEILETLKVGKNKKINHSIALAKSLDLPTANLPLDPYCVGLYLGDGCSSSGVIGKSQEDINEIINYIGYEVKSVKVVTKNRITPFSNLRIKDFCKKLRLSNLLKNKHIPPIYLRASIEQRRELLRGILDTDGYAAPEGNIELCLSNKKLMEDVLELVLSLGIKARMSCKKTTHKDAYRIQFVANFPAFKLKRKLARQKLDNFRPTTQRRYIVDVREIPIEPTKCIEVDSPSRLYLAGKSFIPTHNSYGLLIQPLRFIDIPDFRTTIFRTNSTDFRKSGGLWDESMKVYPLTGARSRESFLDWIFPSGAIVKMHGIKDGDMHEWQSTQIPLIEYEELTHHSEKLFFYMLSRNRSTCGVRPFIRAACNPQYGSWVANLIDWWIGEDGFPIKERSGILRWFVRLKDQMYWADSKRELINEFGDQIKPKSVTFIPATVHDNKILMERDPGYLSNLMALNEFDQMQLLYGNWKVRPSKGTYFKKTKVEIVDCLPANIIGRRRAWDRAATEPNVDNPNPDWTAGVKMERCDKNFCYITDVVRMRANPFDVEQSILNIASHDERDTKIVLTQDPGGAGVTEVNFLSRKLSGYDFEIIKETKDKLTNFKPFSAYSLVDKNVKLLRGRWNESYLNELEAFTGSKTDVDDQVDATSKGFNSLFGDEEMKVWVI